MKKLIPKLCASRWGRLVLSAVLVALVFLIIACTNTVSFLNNDDANIMHALAGDFTGAPYVSHPFINVLLGVIVSTLYSMKPQISWWFLAELFGLYVGAVAITASVIKAFRKRGLPLWMPFATALCLLFLFYAYAVVQLTFTLTAAVLGTGALALILTFGMDSRDVYRPFWAIFAILVLCAGAFLFRNSSGLSLLPFWALAFFYRFFSIKNDVSEQRRARSRRLVCLSAAGAALVFISLFCINRWGAAVLNGEDYVAFNAARGHFMDYPHDSYQNNPEIYEAVGWDEALYEAAECRFYMDERVTADALDYIVDHSSFYQLPFSDRLQKAFKLGIVTARGNGQIQYLLAPMLIILAIASLGFFRRRKGHVLPYAACLLFALGGFLSCMYLCYTGRFLLRTFYLIAYPTAVGMLMTMLPLVEPRCALSAEISRKGRVVNLVLTAVVFTLLIATGFRTASALGSIDVKQTLRLSRELHSYVIQHPTNIYVRTTTTGYDIDPYITYIKKPVNLLDWGGTNLHTGYFKRQLALNDLESFTPEIFKRSDVYFISTVENHQFKHFEEYMASEWAAAGIREVDRIANYLVVYKVEFPA